MTGYGLIAVIPAYKQYKDAVDYYNYLVEHQEGIAAAVRMYNIGKLENYYAQHMVDEKPNDPAPGLLIAPMLRVGNLVGKLFRVQTSVVLSNAGDRALEFAPGMSVECVVLDCGVHVYDISMKGFGDLVNHPVQQTINKPFRLNPGETAEIMLPGGISLIADKDGNIINDKLRQMICEAAGKKLITSCPKLNIDDGVKADIMYNWYFVDDIQDGMESNVKTCYMLGKPGVLRYCGEAFYPEKVK